MSRCCICDSCPETDSHAGKDFKWYDKYGGFVCSVCLTSIFESNGYDLNLQADELGDEPDSGNGGPTNPFAIAETLDEDWDVG